MVDAKLSFVSVSTDSGLGKKRRAYRGSACASIGLRGADAITIDGLAENMQHPNENQSINHQPHTFATDPFEMSSPLAAMF